MNTDNLTKGALRQCRRAPFIVYPASAHYHLSRLAAGAHYVHTRRQRADAEASARRAPVFYASCDVGYQNVRIVRHAVNHDRAAAHADYDLPVARARAGNMRIRTYCDISLLRNARTVNGPRLHPYVAASGIGLYANTPSGLIPARFPPSIMLHSTLAMVATAGATTALRRIEGRVASTAIVPSTLVISMASTIVTP